MRWTNNKLIEIQKSTVKIRKIIATSYLVTNKNQHAKLNVLFKKGEKQIIYLWKKRQ